MFSQRLSCCALFKMPEILLIMMILPFTVCFDRIRVSVICDENRNSLVREGPHKALSINDFVDSTFQEKWISGCSQKLSAKQKVNHNDSLPKQRAGKQDKPTLHTKLPRKILNDVNIWLHRYVSMNISAEKLEKFLRTIFTLDDKPIQDNDRFHVFFYFYEMLKAKRRASSSRNVPFLVWVHGSYPNLSILEGSQVILDENANREEFSLTEVDNTAELMINMPNFFVNGPNVIFVGNEDIETVKPLLRSYGIGEVTLNSLPQSLKPLSKLKLETLQEMEKCQRHKYKVNVLDFTYCLRNAKEELLNKVSVFLGKKFNMRKVRFFLLGHFANSFLVY